MVKFFKGFIFIIGIILILLSNFCLATNKEELIIAINKTYTVGSETYTLPEEIRVKAINYLRTHYFTEEQCAEIMACISNAVNFANQLGTTDVTKLSAEDVEKGMGYVQRAAAIAQNAPKLEDVKKEEITKDDSSKNNINNKIIKKSVQAPKEESLIFEEENISGEEVVETVNILDDNIDYSKYISESQFQDVEFGELKDSIIGEVKRYSLIKILPVCILLVVLVIIVITFRVVKNKIKKKNKEESYEKQN